MHPHDTSPIIIGGASRSGTTLMRVILDAHPHIACGPEIKVLNMIGRLWYTCHDDTMQHILGSYGLDGPQLNRSFAAFCHSFIEQFQHSQGARRWAEKTPINITQLGFFASVFPKAKLVHLLRDGRDVACSLVGQDWIDINTKKKVWYTRDIRAAALYWKTVLTQTRTQIFENAAIRANYIEVVYEDLVQRPEAVLRDLMAFLGEPFVPELLRHHEQEHRFSEAESSTEQVQQAIHQRSLGRWERDMSPQDKEIFKQVAGDTLVELGYADGLDW